MTVKIDETAVGLEVHNLEKELIRALEAGVLTAAQIRRAVDGCLQRLGVLAQSRLKQRLRERFPTEVHELTPVAVGEVTELVPAAVNTEYTVLP